MKSLSTATATTLLSDRTFDIEFNGFLSNHAKHAIIALDRLGAPPSRIQEYWDDYTTVTPYNLILHEVPQVWTEVKSAEPEEWETLRGKKEKWQEMVILMHTELQQTFNGDAEKLVQKYAPPLLYGIAGALTHGIVHLGWAVDAQSPWMIAEGLAYLNFSHVGVAVEKLQAQHCSDASPMESFIRVARTYDAQNLRQNWVEKALASYDESFHPELIPAGFQWKAAKVIADAHPVATALPEWIYDLSLDDLWKDIYHATVWLYLNSRDAGNHGSFLVLHAITSLWGLECVCRTFRDVESRTSISRRALGSFYANLICLLAASTAGFPRAEALVSVRAKFPREKVDDSEMDWTPVVESAIAEKEEHNIKLVYVMKELRNRYGGWSGFSEAARSFTLTPNIGPEKPQFSA